MELVLGASVVPYFFRLRPVSSVCAPGLCQVGGARLGRVLGRSRGSSAARMGRVAGYRLELRAKLLADLRWRAAPLEASQVPQVAVDDLPLEGELPAGNIVAVDGAFGLREQDVAVALQRLAGTVAP